MFILIGSTLGNMLHMVRANLLILNSKSFLVYGFKEVAQFISHRIHHMRLSYHNKWNEKKDSVLIDGNCPDLRGWRTNFVISVFALALKFPNSDIFTSKWVILISTYLCCSCLWFYINNKDSRRTENPRFRN